MIHFIRILKDDFDHPIASSNIYVSTGQILNNSLHDVGFFSFSSIIFQLELSVLLLQKNFESYKQKEGNGFATLIRNDNHLDGHKYRMVTLILS